MRLRSALFGLILATASASCSFLLDYNELTKGGGGGGSSIALEDMPARLAGAVCKRLERCAGPASFIYLGDDDCQILFESVLKDSLFSGMPALPKASFEYHSELAQKCIDAFEQEACTVLFDLPVECKDALDGKVVEGGDCTHPAECVRGTYCLISTACPGKCTAKAGEGAQCGDGTPCLEGKGCNQNTGLCETPAADGQSCGGGTLPSCTIDHFCLGSNKTTSGLCRPTRGDGGVFTAGEGFKCDINDGPLCTEGLSCQVTDLSQLAGGGEGQCQKMSAENAPCSVAVPDECPTHQYCKFTDLTKDITGVCTPLPVGGSPCADTLIFGQQCKGGNRCDTATSQCVALGSINTTCTSPAGCYSGSCDNGYCKAPNFCDLGDAG